MEIENQTSLKLFLPELILNYNSYKVHIHTVWLVHNHIDLTFTMT